MATDKASTLVGPSAAKGYFQVEEPAERRSGIDRRRFCYDAHIPERRTGRERRVAFLALKRNKDFRISSKETEHT